MTIGKPSHKPFGYSYLIDGYGCKPGICDDLEVHYRFAEYLTTALGMQPMSPPIAIHAPVRFNGAERIELFPDKQGVSLWAPLVTSGLQIHSCEPKNFSSLDCYSCNPFDDRMVLEIFRDYFGFTDYEDHWVERGTKYHAAARPESTELV